jgi:hypothetical protein
VSLEQTIELGIRLHEGDDIAIVEKKILLAIPYTCYHFQFAGTAFMNLKTKQMIANHTSDRFETSLYVPQLLLPGIEDSKGSSVEFRDIWRYIVSCASEIDAKFIVVNPDWVMRHNFSPRHSPTDEIDALCFILETMLKQADENRFFLCLENQVADSRFSTAATFRDIFENLNSWWLKISLNINTMLACGLELSPFATALADRIVNVTYSSSDGISERDNQTILSSIILGLLRLPYTQSPFILADRNVADLHNALRRFGNTLSLMSSIA